LKLELGKKYVPPDQREENSWKELEFGKKKTPKGDARTCCASFRSKIKGQVIDDFDEDEFVRVYKTNYGFNTHEPSWDPVTMNMSELCNNNKFLPIRLTVKSQGNTGDDPIYGSVTTTTRGIEMLGAKERTLELTDAKGKKAGSITFNVFQMDMRPSLIDYLQ